MCDNDRNGVIDKGELSEMMRSLVEIARTTSVTDNQVKELIDGMFQVGVIETLSCFKNFNLTFIFYRTLVWSTRTTSPTRTSS